MEAWQPLVQVRPGAADCFVMVSPAQKSVDSVRSGPPETDLAVKALSKALRQKREEAAALVRLIEQTSAGSDKGQYVDYRG